MQFAKSDEGYIDPLSAEVTGNNLLALCAEALIFLCLNLILEIFMDEKKPTSGKKSEYVLSIENVSKYYKSWVSKFKAVDNLR